MAKTSAPAPDYKSAAEEQAKSSAETTNMQNYANRPNQVTPFGSQTWDSNAIIDPATGQHVTQWTQNTTLDPKSQAALDAQLALTQGRSEQGANMMGRVQSEFGTPMDWTQFSPTGAAVGGGSAYSEKAGNAVADQFNQRMEPKFERDTQAMETQLRNQGLKPGDEAYDQQMKQNSQNINDARQQMADQAMLASGNEASRMQGLDIGAGSYNTQQRQQQIAEAMQKRGFSLNEINALISGQQVAMPNMPGFNQAGKADTTQYMTAAQNQYSAAQDAANAQNATISGIANLAGGAMAFSDRRLKSNVTLLGIVRGLRIYVYTIFGKLDVGVMSDEIDQKHVIKHSSGYDTVNYTSLLGEY